MSATQKPKYRVGQTVEVKEYDFSTPGYPVAWMPGTIQAVAWNEDHGLYDVKIEMDRGGLANLRVGRRGGNAFLRPAPVS